MKKAICILSAAFLVLFLFGCAKKEPEVSFDKGFSFNTGIKYKDTSFSARVSCDKNGLCVFEFTDPAPLAGMEMEFENGKISVDYLGLKWEAVADVFPDSAVGEAVAGTIENLTRTGGLKYSVSDEYILAKGGTGNGKFEIYLDKTTKNPVYGKIPGTGIEFSIEDFEQVGDV